MGENKKRRTLRELSTTHREIIRLSLIGKQKIEIADLVGRDPSYVSQILRDPLAKAHIANLQDKADDQVVDIRKRIHSLAPKALDTMNRLMEFGKDASAFNAAKDTLDRAGYAPINKSLNVNVDAIFNSDARERMKQRMKQAEKAGLIVDVPST